MTHSISLHNTGIKPEPIEMEVKVVLISDSYIYNLLMSLDEDIQRYSR
jgi:hypothetical protein